MPKQRVVNRALTLFKAGKSYRQIGESLGVSKQYVHQLIGPLVTGVVRRGKCAYCGNVFQMNRSQRYCPRCSARRKREQPNAKDLCECGRRKQKKSKRCQMCWDRQSRKCDARLVVILYQRGYSVEIIARYFGVTPPAIYRAMHHCEFYPGRFKRRGRVAFDRQDWIPIEQAASDTLKRRASKRSPTITGTALNPEP